eukprot:TRINITY_DN3696_c1_g1_i1.p1 TRINITY_DN3696_c1_g1~~TRINITY_DN3696_c1_g1_i1.p1  ORF type:complete len:477 (-),score=113.16 TRINITY_DN3696_c1_g1_i1:19-1449(-)
MREIVQEATKFMRHSKRTRMSVQDINDALRVRNVEMIHGHSNPEPPKFVRDTANTDLYFLEDKEIDLQELLSQQLPRAPVECSVTTHWLAIEGVQPRIPQNPPVMELTSQYFSIGEGPAAKKRKLGAPVPPGAPAATSLFPGAAPSIEVRPVVKHTLSRELQLLFTKLTESLRDPSLPTHATALRCLTSDTGLHQLVPYLVQFVADETTHNLGTLPLLLSLMQAVQALLSNPNLFIEPYLHQLLPAVLTCLLGKTLSARPTDNHWHLRDLAASIVAHIARTFSRSYPTLPPRLAKTFWHALLDPGRPLPTHYGAIIGLEALGSSVLHLLLIPNLRAYSVLLQPSLVSDSALVRMQAQRVHAALLHAVGHFLFHHLRAPASVTAPPAASATSQATAGPSAAAPMTDGDSNAAPGPEQGPSVADKTESKTGVAVTESALALQELLPGAADYTATVLDLFGEAVIPSLSTRSAFAAILL